MVVTDIEVRWLRVRGGEGFMVGDKVDKRAIVIGEGRQGCDGEWRRSPA